MIITFNLLCVKFCSPSVRISLIFCLLLSFHSSAQLRLAKIFSDNMMLQRDEPIHIWGKGLPKSEVRVTLAKETISVLVADDSTWIGVLNSHEATSEPQIITIISANEKVLLDNILIGDVWLCMGQSNMEWPMRAEKYYHEDALKSDQPMLRFYNPDYAGKGIYGKSFPDSILRRLTADDFYMGEWAVCDSVSMPGMSAVAYHFGKRIVNEVGVPVGLMNLAIGGAPIETFISREVMGSDSVFSAKVEGSWLKNKELPLWGQKRGMQNVGGVSLHQDDLGPNHAYKPGFAFESGIETMLPFRIKGIIWYQGESNAQEMVRVEEYARLMELMVEDYRSRWRMNLPFYFVQLSSIDTLQYNGRLWPNFRDVQRIALGRIENSGMAVTSDIGAANDVHPTNKRDVGERLALWALNKTYKKKITCSGPLPLKATYDNGKVVVTFRYAKGLRTSDGKDISGFSVDGKREIMVMRRRRKIVIPVKKKPSHIYYGWKPFTTANLVNKELLPASTFRIAVQ